MSVASVTNMRYACNSNQACQSKTNLATQAYWAKPAKPTKPNPPIQTKLLGKAVDAWVRSAFGNVSFIMFNLKSVHAFVFICLSLKNPRQNNVLIVQLWIYDKWVRLVSDVESEGKCDSESGIACWECPNQTDWGEGGQLSF